MPSGLRHYFAASSCIRDQPALNNLLFIEQHSTNRNGRKDNERPENANNNNSFRCSIHMYTATNPDIQYNNKQLSKVLSYVLRNVGSTENIQSTVLICTRQGHIYKREVGGVYILDL